MLNLRSSVLLIVVGGIIFGGGALLFLYESSLKQEDQEAALPKVCLEEQDRSKRILCVIRALEEPIATHGVGVFMDALEREFLADDSSRIGGITACHDIAHGIGSAGIEALKDVPTVLASCSALCTYGCYHGTMERYIAKGGNIEKEIPLLCSSVPEKDRSACFHGLGHGIADFVGYDLREAFVLCDKLEAEDARRNCGSGVFMEVYEPSTFDRSSPPLPEDIPSFCASLPGVYDEVCFRNSSSYEYARSRDMQKAFAVCKGADPDFRWPCAVGLGQNIYFSYRGNAQDILGLCAEGTEDEYRACMQGALMSSVVSDSLARHGFEICAVVPKDLQRECLSFLGGHIQSVHDRDQRQILCQTIGGIEKEYCLGIIE